MLIMEPLDPLPPRKSTDQDNEQFEKACKEMEKFFPNKIFIGISMKQWLEMEKASNFYKKAITAILALCSLKTYHQICHEEANRFAKFECGYARSSYIDTWISTLWSCCISSGKFSERKELTPALWPPSDKDGPLESLGRYLITRESISEVVSEFALNIRDAVDTAIDGLLIIPRDSHNIELRIKKDAAGYYLA